MDFASLMISFGHFSPECIPCAPYIVKEAAFSIDDILSYAFFIKARKEERLMKYKNSKYLMNSTGYWFE